MASDYVLKIDGLPAETERGFIEVDSFSWGVTNTGSFAGGGGGGTGKAQEIEFHFTKTTGEASPALMLACAQGRHIKKAELFLLPAVQRHGERFEFKVTLSDVLISSYQNGGAANGADLPMDQVSMNYAKIEFFVNGNQASFDYNRGS